MKILVATDAWHPQVNGVVRTLAHLAQEASALGVEISFLAPDAFFTLPLPGYPEIRLSLARAATISTRIEQIRPDAIHIATEGPIGHGVRSYCLARDLPFTTSFHTRFPDYLAARVPAPQRWTEALAWRFLRAFHEPSATVMAATPGLAAELRGRDFRNVGLWPRGVDAGLFRPQTASLDVPRPIFMTVGRLAPEKNLEAFLALELPGTKVVVGDGPARPLLQQRFPAAVFLGARHGDALAQTYAAADVFVFPSCTDTYGLVLLEALASGVPVAAFPAAAPRDVVGTSGVGVLDEDLRSACLAALKIDRAACRLFAQGRTWRASAQAFVDHVAQANDRGKRAA